MKDLVQYPEVQGGLGEGKLLNNVKLISTTIMLIKYGARSHLVKHFTGMNEMKIRALCHELGIQPVRGKSTNNHLWFAKPTHRAEAIHFYTIYARLQTRKVGYLTHLCANTFLEAYQRYTHNNKSRNLLDIHRAWLLLESIQKGIIKYTFCETCHGPHLIIEGDVARNMVMCVWCELKEQGKCPKCGTKHAHLQVHSLQLTKYCETCKSGRRNIGTGASDLIKKTTTTG